MAQWELMVGAVIVVLACAIDVALWLHYSRTRDKAVDRFVQELARVHHEPDGQPSAR